ncbi:hypothetical protein O1L60_12020 [Streptomyces diastatochromogenes]|nr:hypothetical protein [Streptomyces diastatochromogenes]
MVSVAPRAARPAAQDQDTADGSRASTAAPAVTWAVSGPTLPRHRSGRDRWDPGA